MLPLPQVLRNADRYLLQGTTTLVNACGLATVGEVEAINRIHPMNIQAGTAHVPANVRAAQIVDGRGLGPEHLSTTAAAQIAAGAVEIGEMGGGPTLGGGVQDYQYIPAAVKAETGVELHALQARQLKIAALGRYGRPEDFDPSATARALDEFGLTGRLSVERAREIVHTVTLPPISSALEGFDEATEVSAQTGVPVMFHNSAISAQRILELARRYEGTPARLIAGHSNHNMFEVEECVRMNRLLREAGVVVDVSTLDAIITHWRQTSERIDALAAEGLIDTLSTDYSGGHWDGVLEAVHHLVKKGSASVAQAVAMATGNVARVLTAAAPGRGFVEPGKIADLVLSDDKNIGRVETVIIGGQVVVAGGWLRYERPGAASS
ncbi:MAG: amidohydrolase family protein [Chloroflexi bacterium]|nr:amidohydrolase family protein [Chloroflexota bacterium]